MSRPDRPKRAGDEGMVRHRREARCVGWPAWHGGEINSSREKSVIWSRIVTRSQASPKEGLLRHERARINLAMATFAERPRGLTRAARPNDRPKPL